MRYGKIKDLREDRDLTQSDVAKMLGVNRSTYTMWELGDVNFPIEKLVKLAKIVHSNVEYILEINLDKRSINYPDNIDYKVIGNNLRKFRMMHRRTQKEFAKVLGIRQSSYSYYEEGRTRIPTDKLVTLAKTYHISINELCGIKKKKLTRMF